jgi:hypothetical protein
MKEDTDDILFLLVATKNHKRFIPTFIYFAKKYHPNAHFEIYTDGYTDQFNEANVDFYILPGELRKTPNGARFFLRPFVKKKYTYIGDIDIMLKENIIQFHIDKMKKTGLYFDNQSRVGKEALSGLHFVKTFEYYHHVEKAQKKFVDKIGLDEHYLYLICSSIWDISPIISKNIEEFSKGRPIHGIHLSMNRG